MRKKNHVFKTGLLTLGIIAAAMPIYAQKLLPELEWARHMGGPGWNAGTAITTDPNGNVYSTGAFGGTVNFNPGTGGNVDLTASGNRDIYISKLDAAGHYVWAIQIGAGGTNQGMAITTDHLGNVYIAGQFNGSPDFNSGTATNTLTAVGGTDAFVLKMDAAGYFVWAKNIGSVLPVGQKIAYGIAVDASGNVYTTGEAGGDVFVSKQDASGNFVWAKTMGGRSADYSYDVAVDASGNVYTTGAFSSDTADFDPGATTFDLFNRGSYAIFISKLDANGNFAWAKGISGNSSSAGNFGYGIAVDKSGNVYTNGYFRTTADFNPGGTPYNMTVLGIQDGYVCKYRSSGELVWAKQMGGTIIAQPRGLALDDKGSAYSIGWFNGRTDFDPASGVGDTFNLYTLGSNDIFISKLDSSGNFAWAKSFGSTQADYGYGISVDTNRSVYATGYFSDHIVFDTALNDATFTSLGGLDIFVLKIDQFCSDTSLLTMDVSVCDDHYTLNDETYDSSGVYTQIYPNTSGCDSTITLNLTLKGVLEHPVITVNVFELGTTSPYSTYQWLLNNVPIPNATGSTYTVTENGEYRVVVGNGKGCIDTSGVYIVNNYTGITTLSGIGKQISIYPNPATDMVYIQSPVKVNVRLTDITGKIIRQLKDAKTVSVKDLSDGVYILQIRDENGILMKIEKMVKQAK